MSTGCSGSALVNPSPADIVRKPIIDVFPSPQIKTLYEAFAEQLWAHEQNAFVEPAEILLMSVKHNSWGPKVPFKLEQDFYIGERSDGVAFIARAGSRPTLTFLICGSDRFLSGNSTVVAQMRANEGILKGEEAQLRARKQALATVNVSVGHCYIL